MAFQSPLYKDILKKVAKAKLVEEQFLKMKKKLS